MEDKLWKKDFIEIEFTGRVKGGEIFDSNIKEDLQKISSSEIKETKPLIFSIGEKMFLPGIEDFLIGKEAGNNYEIELSPEKAFGQRIPNFVQVIPLKVFQQNKQNPFPGMLFNFDGRIGKILSVSGGRITVDFNNPLAGKTLIYKVNVLRKVEDLSEKIKSFIEFLFRRDLNFEIKENKLVVEVEKQMSEFVKLFSDKFKDVFGLELEIKEVVKEISEPEKETKSPQ
jgi:FKBP-type peptidyl-prolyl cis-trans isomerase 2